MSTNNTVPLITKQLVAEMLGWRSSARTNAQLIENLKANDVIKNERVAQTMLTIDRGHYCKRAPYLDAPQSIGHSVTISAPHMHAYALEHLNDLLKEGAKALDVGCGSAYLTSCMAHMVGATGTTVGIDVIEELVEEAKKNVRSDPVAGPMLESSHIQLYAGDGNFGFAKEAPFDAIHVGAAAPDIPYELLNQLKPGGRLIAPVGKTPRNQILMQFDKLEDGTITKKDLMAVIYVPLTSGKENNEGGRSDISDKLRESIKLSES